MGALGSFILAGTLKTLSISVESAQIVRVSLANEALARAVGGVLNSPEECKKNLKPGTDRLTGSDSGNGIGDLTQLTKGQDVVLSTSTQNGDNIFKYSFDIIKMQLSGEGTLQKDSTDGDDAKKRTFTVYYKKRGVGSLSTLGDLECSADSQLGCYFYQCDLSYELDNSSPPNVKVCRSLTCVSGGGGVGAEIAGQMCELGEYLVGFTAGGAKICVDMSCDCKDMGDDEATCRSNSWQLGLRGVKRDSEGNMIPDCVQLPKVGEQRRACADGEFVEGYNANGEIICKEYVCSGGMVKDPDDEKKCKCPDAKPYWDGSKCVENSVFSCPATAPYSYNSRCVSSCPPAVPLVGRNQVCQSCMQVNPNTPYWNTKLKKCVSKCSGPSTSIPVGYYMGGPGCFRSDACGEGETRTSSGGCRIPCPSGSGVNCACPLGAIASGGSCFSCPKHRPYLNGSTCVSACPSTKALDTVKKVCVWKHWGCPPDRPKVGTNGQCEACPAGTYWKFVPTTQDFGSSLSREEDYYKENYDDHNFCSSTCPSNQHKYDGRCVSGCPDDKPKVGANNVCEACPTGHHWNRITKTCNNCPSITPYWNTLSDKCVSTCPSGQVSRNGRCVGANVCPTTAPYFDVPTGNCVSTCPDSRPKKANATCVESCPAERPKTGSNNVCEACSGTTPYWNGSACVSACPSDKPHIDPTLNFHCISTCPADRPNKIQIKKGGIFGCINDCSGDLIRGANNEYVCPADKPYRYTGVIGLCVATCTGFTRADDSDGKWCVPNT